MRIFTEASLLEHFYTSFVLCYELYKDTLEGTYKSKTLNSIGINISTNITIEENHSPSTKPVKDCLIYDFSRHLRNAIGHVNFEITGSHFIFKDEDKTKSQTLNAKFTLDEMKEILEKWQLFIVRNFIKTI